MNPRPLFLRFVSVMIVAGSSVVASATTFAGEPYGIKPASVAVQSQPVAASATPVAVLPAAAEPDGTNIDVPEPASMLLLGTGLVGLAGVFRRRLVRRA